MRNFEYDKLDMYLLIATGMNKRKSLWQHLTYIADTMAILETNIRAIEIASVDQGFTSKGYFQHKKSERSKLEELMFFIAMQIKSYARVSQNENLFNKMHYSKSSLQLSRDKDLVFDADILYDIATEHLTALNNFGVNATILTNLQTAITNFTSAWNAPVLLRQRQKEATITIKRIFKETDDLLKNRLDPQMLVFKTSEDQFYIQYTLNRKITGSPTIKTAMRIKVIDAVTKQPLPKTLLVIKDHQIKRLTSPLGQIVIRNLSEGEHTITATLAGYQKQTPSVTHVKGKTTEVLVEMERE